MEPTLYRKDCTCKCHTPYDPLAIEEDTGHIRPCCYDPDSVETDEERDLLYFHYNLWRHVGHSK